MPTRRLCKGISFFSGSLPSTVDFHQRALTSKCCHTSQEWGFFYLFFLVLTHIPASDLLLKPVKDTCFVILGLAHFFCPGEDKFGGKLPHNIPALIVYVNFKKYIY